MRQPFFNKNDPASMETLRKAYEQYMQPGQTLDSVAFKLGMTHDPLRKAFHKFGYPLKVNKRVEPELVKDVQREMECPTDYLSARYNLHPNTVRLWMKKRPLNYKYQGPPAKKWWRGILTECEFDPNVFFAVMTSKPYSLPPHTVPPLFHKHAKPTGMILWTVGILDGQAEYIMEDERRSLANNTEPDPATQPDMFLGEKSQCEAIRYTQDAVAEQPEPSALDEEYDAEDSMDDIDLEALAADLGIDL